MPLQVDMKKKAASSKNKEAELTAAKAQVPALPPSLTEVRLWEAFKRIELLEQTIADKVMIIELLKARR